MSTTIKSLRDLPELMGTPVPENHRRALRMVNAITDSIQQGVCRVVMSSKDSLSDKETQWINDKIRRLGGKTDDQ